MKSKEKAVTALTGGIAHLFKNNKITGLKVMIFDWYIFKAPFNILLGY